MTLFFIILAATAIFVAVEFALVSVRGHELEGKAAKFLHSRFSFTLSTVQVGITALSFIMGSVAEPMVSKQIEQWGVNVHNPVVHVTLLVSIIFTHVLWGEAVAKSLGLAAKKQVLKYLSPVLVASMYALYPLVWVLDKCVTIICRIINIEPAGHGSVLSITDIMEGAKEAQLHGIDEEEMEMIETLAEQANVLVINSPYFIHRNFIVTVDVLTPKAIWENNLVMYNGQVVSVNSFMNERVDSPVVVTLSDKAEVIGASVDVHEQDADYAVVVDKWGGIIGYLPANVLHLELTEE